VCSPSERPSISISAVTSSVKESKAPSTTVIPNVTNTNPTVTATGTDTTTNIAAAEFFIDTDPGIGSGTPMTAVDGAFDSLTEEVTAEIDIEGLSEGEHTVYVRAQDAAGHWGATDSAPFFVDTIGPVTTDTTVDPNPTNIDPTVTATTTDELSTVAAAQFSIDDPDFTSPTSMDAVDGAFDEQTEEVTGIIDISGLEDGEHTVYVRAQDSLENWGLPDSTTFIIDREGPSSTTPVVTPNPTNIDPTVTATLTDLFTNIASGEFSIDDPDFTSPTPMTASDGAFDELTEEVEGTIEISGLSDGEHTVCVRGTDILTNQGPSSCSSFTVDITEPETSNTAVAPNPTNIDPTVTATGTDTTTNIAAAEFFIDTDPGEGSGTPMTAVDGAFDSLTEEVEGTIEISGLSDGEHTVYVRAQDEAGNWDTTPDSAIFTVDVTGPVTTDTTVDPNPTNIDPTVTATTTDELSTVIAAEFFIDTDPGEGSGTPMTAVDGAFDSLTEEVTGIIDISGLEDGEHTVYVRAQDSLENWGLPDSTTFIIDITPPVTSIELDGTLGDNDWFISSVDVTLSCSDEGGSGCDQTFYCVDQDDTCEPDTEFTQVFTIDTEGISYVRYFSTDLATNQEETQSTQVMIDTIPPASSADPLPTYTTEVVFDIPFTANDPGSSGVAFVELFYSFEEGEWTSYGTFESSPISFDSSTTGGDGFYEFETVATDNAGNNETQTMEAEADTTVDTQPPVMEFAITGDFLEGNSGATNKILVQFSEDLDGATIGISDFLVEGHTIIATDEVIPGVVELTLDDNLNTGETPLVNVTGNGVKDLAGNVNNDDSIQTTDGLSPIMESAITRTIVQIDVIFSEDLDEMSVSVSDFEVINGQIPDPLEIGNVDVFSGGMVRLTLLDAFGPDDTPTVNLINDVADNSGNIVSSGSVITSDGIFPTPENITVTFHSGWNFFSVAKELEDPSVSAALEGIEFTQLVTLNTETKTFETPDTIEPLVGYFIQVPEASQVTFMYDISDGNPPTLPDRALAAGWNTIGTTHTETMDAGFALASINSIYSFVCGIFPTDEGSEILCGINVNPNLVEEMGFDTVESRGYWLFNTADSPPNLASLEA